MRALRISLAVLLFAACGDNGGDTPPADTTLPVDSQPVDTTPDGPDPRGPATFELAGAANGLLWDNATSTLFLTDDSADALLKFTDAGAIETVGTLPTTTAANGISLGDIVKLANGDILTVNFGFGMDGAIFRMVGTTSSRLTGADTARKRIGLAQAPDGTLYTGYFTGQGMNSLGGVSKLTVDTTLGTATEVEVVSNLAAGSGGNAFKKVVGLVATNTDIFFSEQNQKKVFKATVPFSTNSVTEVATIAAGVDMLFQMPGGDLLSAHPAGITRVTLAGVQTELDVGTVETVLDMAYDPTLKRLFFIEESANVGGISKLHVIPLDN